MSDLETYSLHVVFEDDSERMYGPFNKAECGAYLDYLSDTAKVSGWTIYHLQKLDDAEALEFILPLCG